MHSTLYTPALLANLAGHHLPPAALSVSSQCQFCADAGASAAVGILDDLAVVGLPDHFACSVQVCISSARAGLAAVDDYPAEAMQACIDAFATGYLGRVQQELRLFAMRANGEIKRRQMSACSPVPVQIIEVRPLTIN